MSVPTEGPLDWGLYMLRSGTAEAQYATNGTLRATSVKAAFDMIGGKATDALNTVANLSAEAHALPRGVDPTASLTGPMGAKVLTLGIPEALDPPRLTSFRALAPVRAALAAGDVTVVGIGDSNVEGANMSQRSQRWFDQFVAGLRERAPGDAGIGWVQAVSQGGPAGFTWSGAGAAVDGHVGGKGRRIDAGGSGTFTGTGNVTVLFKGGTGSFSVKVGAAAAVTVDTGSGSVTGSQTFTATGSNLVTVTQVSGQPVFYGAHFSTATSGAHGWNLGRSGSRADSWAKGDPLWGQPNMWRPAMEAMPIIKPHLVVIALGANNLRGVWGEPYTAKQYASDMALIVSNVRDAMAAASLPMPGFLLVTPNQIKDAIGTSDETQWLAFEQALDQELGDDPLISILHQSDVYAPTSAAAGAAGDPAGYLSDNIHWSQRGHTAMSEFVASWAARGFGTTADAAAAVQAADAAQTAQSQAAQAAADAQTALAAQFLTQDEGVAALLSTAAGPETQAALDMRVADQVADPGAAVTLAIAARFQRVEASVESKVTSGGVPYTVTRVRSSTGSPVGHSVTKQYGSTPGTLGSPAVVTTRPLTWYARQTGASIVTNGSGWLAAGGLRGAQIIDGTPVNDWYPTTEYGQECLAVRFDGTLACYAKPDGDTLTSMVDDGVKHTWSFGPIVARDGAPVDLDADVARYGAFTTSGGTPSARTIIGCSTADGTGDLIILTVPGKSSPASGIVGNAMGQLAVNEGCAFAVCLDGGGSAQAMVAGEWVGHSSDAGGVRDVGDCFAVRGVTLASLPQDTGWRDLILGSGYGVQAGFTPQVRLRSGVLYFRGMVNKTGGFTASTVHSDVATLPWEHPAPITQTQNRLLPGHTAASYVRAYVGTSRTVTVVTGTAAPTYVDLGGLSGLLTD